MIKFITCKKNKNSRYIKCYMYKKMNVTSIFDQYSFNLGKNGLLYYIIL